jgi:hypothetical protein
LPTGPELELLLDDEDDEAEPLRDEDDEVEFEGEVGADVDDPDVPVVALDDRAVVAFDPEVRDDEAADVDPRADVAALDDEPGLPPTELSAGAPQATGARTSAIDQRTFDTIPPCFRDDDRGRGAIEESRVSA